MLPRNIDLTEHQDFSSGETLDELISVWFDNEPMTPVQYEAVCRWESIFGRRHRNEKDRIFDSEIPFVKDETRYPRCGCDIRVPWKRFYGLCKKCGDIQQIPWKMYNMSIRRIGDRGQGDLFELR